MHINNFKNQRYAGFLLGVEKKAIFFSIKVRY